MYTMVQIVKAIAILTAAGLIGNWYLRELRSARREGKPWYAVYLTIPGILIVLGAIFFPIAAWYFKQP